MNTEQLEKYSSAVTLSDMEIFVFPELMYALVLADICSPVIWQWRNLDCFKKLRKKSSYRKLLRLRQFIMDNFEFNLDLETWGLTTKSRELKRFEKSISPQDIARCNALFGYEGDKYYFDVDIRKHFGLDKYDGDIIPYWKTETIEAMDAFRYKPGYTGPAGECVSLAALYVAAAFIVCGVPLEDIYMLLTPLHSQNFIDIQDGFLTNNRRLVTKTMWFNGTAISNKAQRALRNEKVTTVAHPSGYIHCLYKDATIDKTAYNHLTKQLSSYLSAPLNLQVFGSFLRFNRHWQKFFQLCRDCHGQPLFLPAELLFQYEHNSNYRIDDASLDKLLAEVSEEDYVPYELPGRIRCDRLSEFIKREKIDPAEPSCRQALQNYLQTVIADAALLVEKLADFVHTEPNLPDTKKNFLPSTPLNISPDQTREQIIDHLQQQRRQNCVADLAFYAYRDMDTSDWDPFIKAALQRSPVSIKKTEQMPLAQVYLWLQQMHNASIYDGKRLAQPDEVANYRRADGIEKAFTMANVIRAQNPEQQVKITVDNINVILQAGQDYRFTSDKQLQKEITIPPEPG
ncbi:MAG TPA: hypothetical protein VMW23_09355 [Sedimentisphaerales bacterium]|nr:hypothetical protein [Sedimentisphaerales bacterium]